VTKSAELLPNTILENRYEVRKLIVAGSTTRVYLGHHVGLDQPVIIKQLRELYPDRRQAEEQSEQFQVEARLLAKLRHPNLVQVYDTFSVEGVPVLVMEMVPGRNLEQVVTTEKDLFCESTVLKWAHQLLDVLNYLHTRVPPVIVRGLQPSNIILDPSQQLRLVDFGLAKNMDEKGSGTRNIVKGLGEDGFASLEQNAYTKTDARSDIYSLGAVIHYLLTKETPPSSPQRVVAPTDPLVNPQEKNPTVSPATWSAIQQMMAIRPNERPNSASEVARLLPRGPSPTAGKRLCVNCHELLKVEQMEGVEVDICQKCGGLWLDEGELSFLRRKAETMELQAEELAKTIALPADHPAIQNLDENGPPRPFWSTVLEMLKMRGTK